MIQYTIEFTILILIYTNLIRFQELKENTSMFTWKEYWLTKSGITYSLNFIIFSIIFYIMNSNFP